MQTNVTGNREKIQEINKEAAKLKEETNLITRQSAANQLRIDLMFQILKARAENDSNKDATLNQTLRELMTKQNMGKTRVREEKHGLARLAINRVSHIPVLLFFTCREARTMV